MILNVFKKKETIVCFFCNLETKSEESFVLEYRAIDGNGKVNACPMCAGMLNDMMVMRDMTYDD